MHLWWCLADLPPGDYTLELAVDQPRHGVRLTLPGGADLAAIDVLTLPLD